MQTGDNGFDSRTPHKPKVSKISEAEAVMTRAAVNNSRSKKGACFLLNKKEALSGLIQVNGDGQGNGRQAGRVYGCQL